MTYSIKEIFITIQGEGYNSGRKATFCRFSGCNLWNGKSESKKLAKCNFCDTDFVGTNGQNGGKYDLESLVKRIEKLNKNSLKNKKLIVFTGGEPLLQLNKNLIYSLKKKNYEIAVETNGTVEAPEGIDWLCVSPKIKSKLIVKKGNEIKVVFPQKNIVLSEYEKLNFQHFYIQPLENKDIVLNTKKSINYVLKNPKWKLSVQSHKFLKIK